MRHRSVVMWVGAFVGAGLMMFASHASGAETVAVGADPASTFTLTVGEELTIPVYATVTSSTGTPSGIFTYDFDALVNDPASLQVVSFVLDGDLSLGNQSFITVDAAGAHNLNAGFDVDGVGAGTRAELFEVTIKGLAPASTGLSIGDSTVPQGAPIVLFDDSEPQVNASPISVTVTPAAVPEPGTLGMLFAGFALLHRKRSARR